MNIYLQGLNLQSALFLKMFSIKISTVFLSGLIDNYQLLINALLCLAIISMLLLLIIMIKSLRSLKESAQDDKQNAKVWISKKMYDFDAEQLKTLIKKINKSGKNDQ